MTAAIYGSPPQHRFYSPPSVMALARGWSPPGQAGGRTLGNRSHGDPVVGLESALPLPESLPPQLPELLTELDAAPRLPGRLPQVIPSERLGWLLPLGSTYASPFPRPTAVYVAVASPTEARRGSTTFDGGLRGLRFQQPIYGERADLALLAGQLEGDGYLSVYRAAGRRGVRVELGQGTDVRELALLWEKQVRWGGQIRSESGKLLVRWNITSEAELRRLLPLVIPFMPPISQKRFQLAGAMAALELAPPVFGTLDQWLVLGVAGFWLRGLFEADGSLQLHIRRDDGTATPRLALTAKSRYLLDFIRQLVGVGAVNPNGGKPADGDTYTGSWRWETDSWVGVETALAFMGCPLGDDSSPLSCLPRERRRRLLATAQRLLPLKAHRPNSPLWPVWYRTVLLPLEQSGPLQPPLVTAARWNDWADRAKDLGAAVDPCLRRCCVVPPPLAERYRIWWAEARQRADSSGGTLGVSLGGLTPAARVGGYWATDGGWGVMVGREPKFSANPPMTF